MNNDSNNNINSIQNGVPTNVVNDVPNEVQTPVINNVPTEIPVEVPTNVVNNIPAEAPVINNIPNEVQVPVINNTSIETPVSAVNNTPVEVPTNAPNKKKKSPIIIIVLLIVIICGCLFFFVRGKENSSNNVNKNSDNTNNSSSNEVFSSTMQTINYKNLSISVSKDFELDNDDEYYTYYKTKKVANDGYTYDCGIMFMSETIFKSAEQALELEGTAIREEINGYELYYVEKTSELGSKELNYAIYHNGTTYLITYSVLGRNNKDFSINSDSTYGIDQFKEYIKTIVITD